MGLTEEQQHKRLGYNQMFAMLCYIQNCLIFQTAAIQIRIDPGKANFALVITFMLMCLI